MSRLPRQQGLTLIELMVAMVLGLIVLGAVSVIMLNSSQTYKVQDSVARLQENGRFATLFLTRDLRMAGYFGCADDVGKVYNHVDGDAGDVWNVNNAIEGWEGSEGSPVWHPSGSDAIAANIVAGTDAVSLRFLDGSHPLNVREPYMPQPSANLKVDEDNGILHVGDIIAVTDCSSADVFQITGPSGSNPGENGVVGHSTGESVEPGNTNAVVPSCPGANAHCLSKIYEGDAKVFKLTALRYFIGTNARGLPALFRQTLGLNGNNAAQQLTEVVEGIENMQVRYGEDTDGNDRIPDKWVRADQVANWDNVIAVKVVLLAYSIAATETGAYEFTADAKKYDLDLTTADADDDYDASAATGNRKRRVFVSTVFLRNLK